MPITINGTTDYRIGHANLELGAFAADFDGTYLDPTASAGSINPTLSSFVLDFAGQYAGAGAFSGSFTAALDGFSVAFRSSMMSLPLLQPSQFEYIGSFDVPTGNSFQYGPENGAIAFNPDGDGGNGSLFVAGLGSTSQEEICEINIPTLKTTGPFNTATILSGFVQACGGNQNLVEIGDPSLQGGNDVCGMTVYNGRLIIHVGAAYADSSNLPGGQTVSTFARSTDLTQSTVIGPCRIGPVGQQQRIMSGGSMPLPQAWSDVFGGYTSIVGGGGGLARLQTLSNGPCFVFYDPDDIVGTSPVDGNVAVTYPDFDPGTFGPDFGTFSQTWTAASTHRGTFVVNGYRTLVAYGKHGDAFYNQGPPLGTGTFSNTIADRFWLYDASDIKDAFDGNIASDAPVPYTTSDLYFGTSGVQNVFDHHRGGSFDSVNNIFYVVEENVTNAYPRIHAVRINV